LLTHAEVCWRMLTYADVCLCHRHERSYQRLHSGFADVCWRMLTYADVCWRMSSLSSVTNVAANVFTQFLSVWVSSERVRAREREWERERESLCTYKWVHPVFVCVSE
jgi:hypothetical protein